MKNEEDFTRRERVAGLVLELQRAASDSSVAVSDLLRKALLAARKLKNIDQESWILFELEGYSDAGHKSFPAYRLLGDDIKCYCESFLGTFVTIPSLLSETGLDFYEKQLLKPLYGISVYEIERLLKYSTKNAEVSMPCPPCAEAAVIKLTGVPTPITLVFQEYSLTGILDAVRNRIIDWTSELEEKGIIVEDPSAQTGAGEPQKPTKKRAYTPWPKPAQEAVGKLWSSYRTSGGKREIDCYEAHKGTARLPEHIKSFDDFQKCKECAERNGIIPRLTKKRGKTKGKPCQ